MGKNGKEKGFSWGDGSIPGRRITLRPGESIAVYNSNGMPNITGRDLITTKPFVSPTAWREQAEEFVKALKRGATVVFSHKQLKEPKVVNNT